MGGEARITKSPAPCTLLMNGPLIGAVHYLCRHKKGRPRNCLPKCQRNCVFAGFNQLSVPKISYLSVIVLPTDCRQNLVHYTYRIFLKPTLIPQWSISDNVIHAVMEIS